MANEREIQQERRFGGVARLYGEVAYQAFSHATVVVIGLGGVGSWAAEALARSAIGHLVLIDFDHIVPSNVNRQLHALEGEFGRSKVGAMSSRLKKINPEIQLTTNDVFIEAANLEQLIPKNAFVLDACDDAGAKIDLAVFCRDHSIPLVMCGGAGGKLDPTAIRVADLAKTTQDPLLAKIRASLRKNHSFCRDLKRPLGISAVYSIEPRQGKATGGLACSGYGSAVTVTAAFGFAATSTCLNQITNRWGDIFC